MSGKTIGWVYDESPFTGATFAVHLAIGDSANDQHAYEIWMRVETIADKARVSVGAARRAIGELVDAGCLVEIDAGRRTATDPRPRQFRMLPPDHWRSRRVREQDAEVAHTARVARAHGASYMEPKVEPKVEPKNARRHCRSTRRHRQPWRPPAVATT